MLFYHGQRETCRTLARNWRKDISNEMTRRARDLIAEEVISGFLVSTADEQHVTLQKTAYSLNIKERADCSTCIFDANGQTLALSSASPIHLGSMLGLVMEVLKRFPKEALRPGDMFIANDPYNGGGSHLPDITVLAPVFVRDVLVAFVANTAHHSDIGGRNAGSSSGDAEDIFQEGLRLPPIKIFDSGTVRSDIIELVCLNSRVPTEREGDLHAQFAANLIGVRRVQELCEKYGIGAVTESMERLLTYSERRIRYAIGDMKDGIYTCQDSIDDGTLAATLRLSVSVEISGDRIRFDFAGSSPQTRTPKNMPRSALLAVVYTVIKQMIDPGLPTNAGYYRAIDVNAPEGSIVNCRPPAAVAGRALTANILGDVIAGALSQAMPSRSIAASGPYLHSITSGEDPSTNGMFVCFEAFAGGMGARNDRDGMDVVRIWASGGANQSVEAMEQAWPLVVERYELACDTGGAGENRGGLGCVRDLRVLVPARLSMSGGRMVVPASGSAGGGVGGLGQFVLNPGTSAERILPATFTDLPMRAHDVVRLITPGGGGYGNPILRDAERVRLDVVEGRVSESAARETYGVEISHGEVDDLATRSMRALRTSTSATSAPSGAGEL